MIRDYSPTERIRDENNEKIFSSETRVKLKKIGDIETNLIKEKLKPKLDNLDKKAIHSFSYKDLGINIFTRYSVDHKLYNESWQDEYSGVILEYKDGWGFYISYGTQKEQYFLI